MIIFINIVIVIKDTKVDKETTTAAYSFSLSKLSANIAVIAEAGIEDIIITVWMAFEVSPKNKEKTYIIAGIIINFAANP